MKTRRTIALVLGIMVLMTVFAAGCASKPTPRTAEDRAADEGEIGVVGTSSPENPGDGGNGEDSTSSPDNP